MKITSQEKEQRKERIIQTAFQLFCERGIEQVSLADIAKQSKVGEASIYRYFKNKIQLVFCTLNFLWKEISVTLEAGLEEIENFDLLNGYEQFKARLRCYKKLYIDNADYVLFSYEAKLYLQRNQIQLKKEEYDSIIMEVKENCIAALNKGKLDGSIPVERDTEDLFYAIWGAVRGYVVKIVVYDALFEEGGPWEKRYDVMEQGILCALKSGWK